MTDLTQEQLASISPLGHLLLAALRGGRLPPTAVVEFTDRLVIRIPAASSNVGDLRVLDDGDEYTVFVGRHTHYHFMLWPKEHSGEVEAQLAALEELLVDLRNVVSDETVIWSSPRGSGGVFSIGLDPKHIGPGAQAWLWSGKRFPLES